MAPVTPPPGSPASSSEDASPLLAFTGTIRHTRASPLYRLGLLVVAVAMVLLPLLYVGLIVGVLALLRLHVLYDTWILGGGGGGGIYRLIAYVGPIVVGGILVVFMVKPLFSRAPRGAAPYLLDPAREPLLFEFIGRICGLLRAPVPAAVAVDCNVNASAGLRRGWFSMFGRDLTLTIGLPLAAGLTQRQFAGVLAHEFGHFAQGAGVRFTYVIRSINGWFSRIVYGRDSMDVWLDRVARGSDWRIGIVLQMARGAVWLTRRVLWAFMMAGHAISCFMQRQMEFDADGCEAKLAGSEAFAATMRRIRELTVASQATLEDLREGWQRGRLPDDLPGFVVRKEESFSAETRVRIHAAGEQGRTGPFDTHPADADRVRAAERLEEAGIFHRDDPATELFGDFDVLARAATRHHYERELELPIKDQNLVATEDAIRERGARAEEQRAFEWYFQGAIPVRPLGLEELELAPSTDRRECIAQLRSAREAMAAAAPVARESTTRFIEQEQEAMKLFVAGRMREAGYWVPPEGATGPAARPPESAVERMAFSAEENGRAAEAARESERLAGELEPFSALACRRLASALRLLSDPQVASRLVDVEALRAEAAALVKVLSVEGGAFEAMRELRRELDALRYLVETVRAGNVASDAQGILTRTIGRVRTLTGELQAATACVPYPFLHSRGAVSVAEYLRPDEPAGNEVADAYQAAGTHVERSFALYYQALARLAAIAEQVEGVALESAEAAVSGAPAP